MSGTSFEHGRSPAALRCALIGDEPLVIQCAQLAAAAGLTVTLIATDDPWVAAEAAAAGTPVVTPGAGLADALRAAEVDVLFSVANLRILPAEVLDAVRLAVNFHDGPLPSYAGMHVTTWALLAGETEHGVTWHVMTQDVDGGAILAEERFAIAPDETAYSLNARCFEAALRSFPAVAAAIAAGPPSTRPQAPGELRMFGRHLRPGSRSLVDPRRPAPELVRVGRALDLGDRTPNRIGRSRLVSPNGAWLLAGVDVDNAVLGEGDVRAVDGALLIGAAGGTLRAVHLTELDGAPAAAEAVAARIGTRLAPPDPALVETLDTTDAELSKAEAAWSRRLADLPQPLGPELGDGSGWDEVAVAHLPGVDLALAAAVTATWAARLGGATSAAVGVVDGPTGARLAALAPLAAPPVVTVTPTTESDQRVVADEVAAAVARGP